MKFYSTPCIYRFLAFRQRTHATLPQRSSIIRFVSVSSVPRLQSKITSSDNPLSSTSKTNAQVYEGPLTRMVKGVKVFSISTSCLGLMCQPILLSKSLATSSIIVGSVGAFIAVYSIVTPLLLHWIVKRYVVRLYFDSNTKSFTSITLGFFNTQKKLQFSASDVFVPEVESPLTTFIVQGKPLLVDPDHFSDLSIYGHLMGYDKPLDLQLGKQPAQETK